MQDLGWVKLREGEEKNKKTLKKVLTEGCNSDIILLVREGDRSERVKGH